MTFYLLVTIITWSFSMGAHGYGDSKKEIVYSPESAAVRVWGDKKNNSNFTEPDHKKYILYEINLENQQIIEIPIPIIDFKTKRGVL